MSPDYPVKLGELRPSQLLYAFGVGAMVDLPRISVIVLGLDFWNVEHSIPIGEARLLNAIRKRKELGSSVKRLLAPPLPPGSNDYRDPFSPEAYIGVPVSPFPRYLRCPLCQLIAEYDSGLFELKTFPYRPDRNHFVHANCQKAKNGRYPTAVPARFLVACRNGHLDDFPWHWFVHRGLSNCKGQLRFFERGASPQPENLWVRCDACGQSHPMSEAFGLRAEESLPACRRRHPHLNRLDDKCLEPLKTILIGASNSWFPITMSVLSIPTGDDELHQMIEDKWQLLKDIPNRDILPNVINPLALAGQLPGFEKMELDDIWRVIEEIRNTDKQREDEEEVDLKKPEWDVFTNPNPPLNWPDFMVRSVGPPDGFSNYLDNTILAERLREVVALIGFTRVEPPEESQEGENPPEIAPLSSHKPEWVPATEVRGEGIFIRFSLDRIDEWLKRDSVRKRTLELLDGHIKWRKARKLEPAQAHFPGALFILLHTFAHVLLRELSLECGYGAASIRERIYASLPDQPTEMAGVLLYTAAPDSDGTLGGLVELGRPDNLGRLITQALERSCICSSDPLCAEHTPRRDRTLHGAACHACAFVPETSCEKGNRYLDRSLLVSTYTDSDLAFFEGTTR